MVLNVGLVVDGSRNVGCFGFGKRGDGTKVKSKPTVLQSVGMSRLPDCGGTFPPSNQNDMWKRFS